MYRKAPRNKPSLQSVYGLISGKCPECAADITPKGATVFGMRVRNLPLLWVSLLMFVVSGPALVVREYRMMTEPGWEKAAPAWWLAHVELNFASGARFDEACAGVLWASRNKTLSQSQLDDASRKVFDRLCSQSPPEMAMHAHHVYTIVGTAGSYPDRDVKDIVRVVRACVSLPTQTAGDETRSQVDKPTARFVPQGWELKFSGHAVDSKGAPAGTQCTGLVARSKTGSSSSTRNAVHFDATDTYRVIWEFELGRSGEASAESWSEEMPFVYDHEKASAVAQEQAKARIAELEERVKAIKARKAAKPDSNSGSK